MCTLAHVWRPFSACHFRVSLCAVSFSAIASLFQFAIMAHVIFCDMMAWVKSMSLAAIPAESTSVKRFPLVSIFIVTYMCA